MAERRTAGRTPTGEHTVRYVEPNSLRGSVEAVPAFWRGTIRNAAVPILAYAATFFPEVPQTLIATAAAGAFGWAIKKGVENHIERRETRLGKLFDRKKKEELDEVVEARKAFWTEREEAWNTAAIAEWHRRHPDGTPPPAYATNFTDSVKSKVEWPYEEY